MQLLFRTAFVLLLAAAAACSKPTQPGQIKDAPPDAAPAASPAPIPPGTPGFNTREDIVRLETEGAKRAEDLIVEAQSLAKEGKSDEALATLQKAVEEDPLSAKAHCLLGQELLRRGESMGAEKMLRHAMRLDPALTEAIVSLADLQLSKNKRDEAAALYRVALSNDASNEPAKAGLDKAVKPPEP